MAGFGPDATQLSAPQGAGATPVAPVQQQAGGIDLSGIGNVISSVGGLIHEQNKQKAAEDKSRVMAELAGKIEGRNQAAATGQISKDQAVTETAALYQTYQRMYSEYTEDFTKQANFNKQFGTSGKIEKDVDSLESIRTDKLKKASDNGIYVGPGMDKEAQDAVIRAQDTATRLQLQIKESRENAADSRTTTKWEQEQADRQTKEESTQILSQIGASNLEAFNAMGLSLSRAVSKGMDPIEAQGQFQAYYSKIQGAITASSAKNPEIAGPFKELFDKSMKLFVEHMKPGSDITALENDIKRLKLVTTKEMLSDEMLLRGMVFSESIKNYPEALLAIGKPARRFLLGKSSNQIAGDTPSERVVGNESMEKDVLKGMSDVISKYNNGTVKGDSQVKSQKEINNMLLGTLNEFTDQYKLGKLSPESRGRMFDLMSSSEVGKFIKENPLDAETKRGLYMVYQSGYASVFQYDLNKKLSQTLGGNVRGMGPPIEARDMVDITFDGSGLVFTPKGPYQNRAKEFTSELSKIQSAASKIIHIGAHLEGTTDYKAFWENNKALLLPSMGFEPPSAPAKKPTGSYKTDADLKNQVAAPAGFPTPASESRSQRLKDIEESIRVTTDGNALQVLLKERDKVMKGQ